MDKMGQMSSDLRESSKKYKRAAVRINWELLLKQVRRSELTLQRRLILITSNSTLLSRRWASSCLSSSGGASYRSLREPFLVSMLHHARIVFAALSTGIWTVMARTKYVFVIPGLIPRGEQFEKSGHPWAIHNDSSAFP